MKKHRTRAQNENGRAISATVGRVGLARSASATRTATFCRRSFSAPTATAAKAKRELPAPPGRTSTRSKTPRDGAHARRLVRAFFDDTRKACEPKTFANYRLALGHLLPLIGNCNFAS